jgi:hypothetical protein
MHAAHARHIRGTDAVQTRRACSHTKHTKQRGARQEHEQNGATHNNTRKKWGGCKYTELNEQMSCISDEAQEVYELVVTD